MSNKVPVKFYFWSMPNTPVYIPNKWNQADHSFINVLSKCLVTGFNEQTPTSAQVNNNVCRIHLPSGKSYGIHSTILLTGSSTSDLNGEHIVVNATDDWIEFNTNLSDTTIDVSGMSIKYAPAGWEHPFPRETNLAVFRSKNESENSHRRYLKTHEENNHYIRTHAFEAMTANNNNNNLSLTNSYSYQTNICKYVSSSNDPRFWAIVASDTFFYLFTMPHGNNNHWFPCTVFAFGDTINSYPKDKNNTILKGYTSNNLSTLYSFYDFFNSTAVHDTNSSSIIVVGGYIKDSPSIVASSCVDAVFSDVTKQNSNYYSGNIPGPIIDPITNEIPLLPCKVLDFNYYYRGNFPGMYFIKSRILGTYSQFEVAIDETSNKKYLAFYIANNSNYNSHFSNSNNICFLDITGTWQ